MEIWKYSSVLNKHLKSILNDAAALWSENCYIDTVLYRFSSGPSTLFCFTDFDRILAFSGLTSKFLYAGTTKIVWFSGTEYVCIARRFQWTRQYKLKWPRNVLLVLREPWLSKVFKKSFISVIHSEYSVSCTLLESGCVSMKKVSIECDEMHFLMLIQITDFA